MHVWIGVAAALVLVLSSDGAENRTSPQSTRQCREEQVTKDRLGVLRSAVWASENKKIRYSQGDDRWSGIQRGLCPFTAMPPTADCASFATWLIWACYGDGADFVNGNTWAWGNTDTIMEAVSLKPTRGRFVKPDTARPGDIVVWGWGTKYSCCSDCEPLYCHAAVWLGPNYIVSFGGPKGITPVKRYRDVSEHSGPVHIVSFDAMGDRSCADDSWCNAGTPGLEYVCLNSGRCGKGCHSNTDCGRINGKDRTCSRSSNPWKCV